MDAGFIKYQEMSNRIGTVCMKVAVWEEDEDTGWGSSAPLGKYDLNFCLSQNKVNGTPYSSEE